jgi:hypothetical protein
VRHGTARTFVVPCTPLAPEQSSGAAGIDRSGGVDCAMTLARRQKLPGEPALQAQGPRTTDASRRSDRTARLQRAKEVLESLQASKKDELPKDKLIQDAGPPEGQTGSSTTRSATSINNIVDISRARFGAGTAQNNGASLSSEVASKSA